MSAKRELPEEPEIFGDTTCIDEKEYVDPSSEDYWKQWRD